MRGRKSISQRGISLIEVMVTMVISMGLVLAIMTAVQNTNQAVKSSSLTNDWITLLAGIRETYADTNQCTLQFSSYSFPGASLSDGTVLANLPDLTVKGAGGAVVSTFLSTTSVVNNFKANTLQLIVSPGNQTQTILVGNQNRYLDHVELNIVADKVQTDGTTAVSGGVTRLQSNAQRNNAIKFTILRVPATGAVQGCYGQNDAAQQACNEMGGAYGPAGASPPRCQLPRMFHGSNGQLSTPAAGVPNRGQRIQLWANTGHGISDPNDYAIGMNTSTMWFNAGELGGDDQFQFTNNAGTKQLLSVGPSGTTINSEGGNTPHQLFGYVLAGGPGAYWWAGYDKNTAPPANGFVHIGNAWNASADMDCGADAWLLSYKCECYCTDTPNCHTYNQGRLNYHAASCNCYSNDGGIGLGDMHFLGEASCAKY